MVLVSSDAPVAVQAKPQFVSEKPAAPAPGKQILLRLNEDKVTNAIWPRVGVADEGHLRRHAGGGGR